MVYSTLGLSRCKLTLSRGRRALSCSGWAGGAGWVHIAGGLGEGGGCYWDWVHGGVGAAGACERPNPDPQQQ